MFVIAHQLFGAASTNFARGTDLGPRVLLENLPDGPGLALLAIAAECAHSAFDHVSIFGQALSATIWTRPVHCLHCTLSLFVHYVNASLAALLFLGRHQLTRSLAAHLPEVIAAYSEHQTLYRLHPAVVPEALFGSVVH